MTVSEPELVVTLAADKKIPKAKSVPFAAVPVIVTWPAPVAEMLEDEYRRTPAERIPVPHEVPLTLSEPEMVVTVAEFAKTP